jgi:hypothetical protein
MIGPLPTTPGGFNRVLVAIDKFTKWIEVKPVTCPKADRVLDFLDELVHRYGLPHRIITDLGSNINNNQFWEYCENSWIDVRYVSVAHPRTNGQVERTNGMVLDALNKRLHDSANTKGGIASILGAPTLSYLVDNQLCIVQEIHGLDLGRGSTQHGDG